MSLSTITALSPLDGRYASKLAALRPIMSEHGYMHRRVQVEVAWFIALSDAGFAEFKPLTTGARAYLLGLIKNFSEADAAAIKEIEKTTNHDVKAVEYWIKSKFEARPELEKASEFVHFACTSEDINNTSHALQLRSGRDQVILPGLDRIVLKLREMSHAFADVPMLSRTHGQTASPTTVGKEMANVVMRLQTACEKIAAVKIMGKMNGAVGNYNAHLSAWPEFDWEAFQKEGHLTPRAAGPGPDLPAVLDPDRAARLHGRAVRCRGPRQHHPDRPLARHLGLREPGLLQAAPEGGRDWFQHHAAQGQPD